MDFKMLHYVKEEAVALITLDYAPTLNALDMNLALELEAALQQAETDSSKSRCVDRSRSGFLRRRRYPLYEGAL